MRHLIGKLFQWFNVPGFIKPLSLYDENIGQIVIKTCPIYTIIVVDGKEFFFRRIDGKYDGWGGMALDPELVKSACYRADYIPELNDSPDSDDQTPK